MMKKNYLLLSLGVYVSLAAETHDAQYTMNVKNNSDETVMLQYPIPPMTTADIIVKLADLHPQAQLHRAILANSKEDVLKAIQEGADVNCGKDGKAPILLAVLLKRDKAVEGLLECNANVNVVYNGMKLIHRALHMNDLKIATLLMRQGAVFSGNICRSDNVIAYLLRMWLKHESLEVDDIVVAWVQEYMDRKYYCNVDSRWLWQFALSNTRLLEILFNNGFDPNEVIVGPNPNQYTTPLIMAIEQCNKRAAKILLDAGANINKAVIHHSLDEYTPLFCALHHMGTVISCNNSVEAITKSRKFADMAEFLIVNGAYIGANEFCAAIQINGKPCSDYIRIIKLALKNGANPNLLKKDGTSPLHLAIVCKNAEAVKILLRAGADPNQKAERFSDSPISVPLSCAVEFNDNDLIELLIEYGAQL